MKKQFKRVVSTALATLTAMSSLTCLSTFAAETGTNSNGGFYTMDTDKYATGGMLINKKNLSEDVDVIESMTEYRKKELAMTGSSAPVDILPAIDNSVANERNGNKKYFPQIRNQDFGSCTAWAECYYQFTYEMNKTLGRVTTEKNTFNPLWPYNCLNGGKDQGVYPQDVYNFLQTQGGVDFNTLPYVANLKTWHPGQTNWTESTNYRIDSYQIFNDSFNSNIDFMKEELSKGNVLAYTTFAFSWVYTDLKQNSNAPENTKYKGEKAVVYQKNNQDGCHRMTLVGYNDNIWVDINDNNQVDKNEMGAFKVANSWGSGWGNNGFMWVAYDALYNTSRVEGFKYNDKSAILYDLGKITVKSKASNAGINLVYTLDSAKRNQTKIKVYATKGNSTYEGEISPYSNLYYREYDNVYEGFRTDDSKLHYDINLGELSYSGKTISETATMAYALDNLTCNGQKIKINSHNINDFVWKVVISDYYGDNNMLSAEEVKIVDANNGQEYPLSCAEKTTMDGKSRLFTLNSEYCDFQLYDAENDFETDAKVNARTKYFFAALGGTAPYTYTYQYKNLTNPNAPKLTNNKDGGNLVLYYNEEGTYQITVTVKDAKGITLSKTYKINATQPALETEILTSNMSLKSYNYNGYYNYYETSENNNIEFNVITKNEILPYPGYLNKSSISIIKNGETIFTGYPDLASRDIHTLKSKHTLNWIPQEPGKYEAVFTISDAPDRTVKTYCYFTVKPSITRKVEITNVNTPNGKTNSIIKFTADAKYDSANNMSLTIKKDGVQYLHETNTRISYDENDCVSNHSVSWIPQVAGTYTAEWSATNVMGIVTKKTSTITVEKGTPLAISCTSGNASNTVNINTQQIYTFQAYNGNGDYTYTYSCKHSGPSEGSEPCISGNGNTCTVYLYETGYNQLIVTATDSTGRTGSQSFFINTVDNNIEISKHTTPYACIGTSSKFTISTQYESIPYPSYKNPVSLTIKKDNITVATPTVEYTEKNISHLTAKYSANWTPTSTGKHTAIWKVTDSKGRTATKSINFQVYMPISLVSGKLSDVNINTAQDYSFSASGGTAPYTYEYSFVKSGNMTAPTIINNGASCRIYFRSTGYNHIIVKATDSKGNTGSSSYFINVVDKPIEFVNQPTITGTINEELTMSVTTLYEAMPYPSYKNPVSVTITKSGKTVATPTVSYSTKGMDTLTSNYSIKFTPTETGSYTATWKVTDSKGRTATKSIAFYIYYKIVPTCNLRTTSNVNTLYRASFGACFGTGPFTYSYSCQNISNTSAAAPTVINNGSSCSMYFKSTGTHKLTVTVRDANGKVGLKSYLIEVVDNPLAISTFTATAGKVNSKMTFTAVTQNETMYDANYKNKVSLTITQQNGTTVATPTVSYTSKNFATLTGNYSASWTPTKKGTYCAIMRVTDYAGRTTSRTYYFTVS